MRTETTKVQAHKCAMEKGEAENTNEFFVAVFITGNVPITVGPSPMRLPSRAQEAN